MRALRIVTIVLFCICLAAFGVSEIYNEWVKDTTPPVIRFESDLVEYSINSDRNTLLSGVTADDGSPVQIESISQLVTADTAIVRYIAFDEAGNMGQGARTVRYIDYKKPEFSLTKPLIYSTDSSVKLLDRLYAYDVVDGDLSGNIRITSQNLSVGVEGTYSVMVQVTNSLGDTASLPLTIVVNNEMASQSDPPIELSQYLVYLDAGEDFDAASYLVGGDSGVSITELPDSSSPGVYETKYTADHYTVIMTVVVR